MNSKAHYKQGDLGPPYFKKWAEVNHGLVLLIPYFVSQPLNGNKGLKDIFAPLNPSIYFFYHLCPSPSCQFNYFFVIFICIVFKTNNLIKLKLNKVFFNLLNFLNI